MICAEDELGLGTDHEGILVLDADAVAGEPFAAYLHRQGRPAGDAVLDVAVTPNRPDATSHVGVARDVAALLDLPLLLPEVDEAATDGEAAFAVAIEDPEGCPRYVGLVVRGVRVGPSPEWLAERLRARCRTGGVTFVDGHSTHVGLLERRLLEACFQSRWHIQRGTPARRAAAARYRRPHGFPPPAE